MTVGYSEAEANAHVLGFDTNWVQIHIGDPGADGTANPATETDRRQISLGTPSGGVVSNDAVIEWDPVDGAQTPTHASLWTASTAGELMAITFVQATFSTIDEYHDYTLSSAPTDGNILLFIGNFQTAGDVSDLTAEGFTVVFNRVGANDAVLAWKEASGDSAALMNLASSGFNDAGIVAEYSGVDTTTPIEDSDWDDDFNDSVAVAVTAGGDGRVHVIGVSMEGSTDFSSDGFTERLDDTTAGRTQLHDKVATSGVNGPFTDSGTLQTQVVFSFLLNPTAASNVAPGDPTGVAATAADSQATVTWSDGTIGVPEETYDVDRGTTSIGPWTSMATGLARSTQTYTDTSAANGTEYFYRVRGTNSEGASAWVVSNGATPQASTKVIKIQRGSLDVTASTTITLAEPVADLTKAYVRLVNSRNQGAGPVGNSGNQQPDDLGVTVQLTAVDTIAVGYSGGTGSRIEWEIMEYVGADGGPHEFRVRHRGEQTLAGATNTVSEAFDTTPTNIADCIPFWSVRSDVTSGSEFENVTARVQLSGSDQVDYSSAKDQGNTVIATEVVEYVGSAWAVHVGTQEGGTTDSGTITLGTSVSDWANAAVVSWGYEGDQSNEAIADHYPLLIPDTGTANEVDWRFDGNADGTDHDIVVYVLENASMAVTRYSWAPSGTAPVEGTVDIASAGLTELSRAAVYATAISSGSGTALGRGYRNAYLSTLVLLVLWCHRTGNTVEAHAEVVDYDGLEDAGSSATEGTAAFSGAGTMAAGGDVGRTTTTGSSSRLAGMRALQKVVELAAAGAVAVGVAIEVGVGWGLVVGGGVVLVGSGIVASNPIQQLPPRERRPDNGDVDPPPFFHEPFPGVPWEAWIWEQTWTLAEQGRCYGWITEVDGRGYPLSMRTVPPDVVWWRYDRRGRRWRVFLKDGDQPGMGEEVELWPRGRLWHVPMYTLPGLPQGMSPVHYHARSIGLGLSAQRMGLEFFDGGGHPTMIVKHKKGDDEKGTKAAQLKQRIAERLVGGVREPLVVPESADIEKWQIDPAEALYLDSINASGLDVCRIYGTPAFKVQLAVSGQSITYQNVADANASWQSGGLSRYTKRLESYLSMLIPSGRRRVLRFDFDEFLRPDQEKQARIFAAYAQMRNENVSRHSLPTPVLERVGGASAIPTAYGSRNKGRDWVDLRRQTFEHRVDESGRLSLVGYATSWDTAYDVAGGPPYGWVEEIASGAATKSLMERDDVRFLFDHEGIPMARNKSRTMSLEADPTGLLVRVDDLDTERNMFARALASAIERGDVDQMSFAFQAIRQEWDDRYEHRRILELRLFDVSAVSFPANEATIIGVDDRQDDPPAESREMDLSLARAIVDSL
eukprot:g14887.t1